MKNANSHRSRIISGRNKEFDDRLHNIEYNYTYLLGIIEESYFNEHLEIIQRLGPHQDKIEVLLKVFLY